MPGVALRIVDLCQQDEVALSDVSRTLAQDPVLAAKILRFANSAAVAGRGPVKTISSATSLLGLLTVQTLALSFSLVSELKKGTGRPFDARQFWRRSLFAAVAGRATAYHMGLPAVEEVFLAALLQDIGILILTEVLGDEYEELVRQAGGDHAYLTRLEMERLGFDHSTLGAWLAQEWRLPTIFSASTLASHGFVDQRAAPCEGGLREVCQVVALSGRIADIWMSSDVPAATQHAEKCALEHLGLEKEPFARILEDVASRVSEAALLTEIEAGNSDRVQGVLTRARDSLVNVGLRGALERSQLQDVSRRDPLTGVYNRSYVDGCLSRMFSAARDFAEPFSVAFVDIDHFKSVNDDHGHSVGDLVLKIIAQEIAATIRSDDVIGRYGGEEFVALLPKTPAAGAARFCERLREAVESTQVPVGTGAVRVTVSIGHATLDPLRHFAAETLVQEADAAMYEAKHRGRNRVVAGGPTAPSPVTPLESGEAPSRSVA
jgi:diguanylate cyclase (GGDEF)-like protein